MKKLFVSFLLPFVLSCAEPAEPTRPFVKITLLSPEGFPAPNIDHLQVKTSAVINGSPISNTNEIDLVNDQLPTDFVIRFSEPVRGSVVDFEIHGLQSNVDVFSVLTSAIADTSEIELIVSFCGDQATDPTRSEECDDGPNNSDTQADACRTDCRAASCGDGITDTGEQCDDGDQNSDTAPDGCRTSCQVAFCGDGIVDANEDCEDSNNADNDGCDNDCAATAVVQLAAGFNHTCALLHSGTVRCWGQGAFGRLGYGNEESIGNDELPSTAGDINVGGKVVQITAGGDQTCALLDTGAVRCWGDGSGGAHGQILDIGDNEPPAIAGDAQIGGTAIQVSTSGIATCALLNTGNVRCWGEGSFGQLGYGNTNQIGDNELPLDAGDVPVGGLVSQITTGNHHTCALMEGTNNVRCWGDGTGGKLGYGNLTRIGDNETPASVGDVNEGSPLSFVSAGSEHTCVLQEDKQIKCWGVPFSGRLGYGSSTPNTSEQTPNTYGTVPVGANVISLAAGDQHTCALLESKNVICWGLNSDGQLGNGGINNVGDDETPALLGPINVGGTVEQVVAGASHTCTLLTNGTVRCWGSNDLGQLGLGDTIGHSNFPAEIEPVTIF